MKALRKIFRSAAERKRAAQDAQLADPIIDRLMAKTERRLALVPDYREALRGTVIAARDRVAEMIARIPGPFEVSPRSWSHDPALRPLFARGEDAARAYSGDEGVRAFFDAHPASDCFGMLALLQSKRKVLAMVQQGEIQTEVARNTMSFGEPQVLAPAVDDVSVRGELALRALEYLALRAMERVGAMRSERRELEKERSLLRAQLQLAERRGAGFGAVSSPFAEGITDRKTLEQDLARTVGELEQAASRNLLPALLEEILAAFEHPGEHLAIEPCTLSLDAMNFEVAPGPQAVTPCVAQLKLARRGPFAVLVGRFPRAELRAPENRFAEAARYL